MKSALGQYVDVQKFSSNNLLLLPLAIPSKRQFMSPPKMPPFHTKKPSEQSHIGSYKRASEKPRPVAHLWKDFKKPQPAATLSQHKKSCSIFQHTHKSPFLLSSLHHKAPVSLAESGTEGATLENILQQTCGNPTYFTGNDSTLPHTNHIRTQSEALAQICLNSCEKSFPRKTIGNTSKLTTPKPVLKHQTNQKQGKPVLSPGIKENSISKKLFTSPVSPVPERQSCCNSECGFRKEIEMKNRQESVQKKRVPRIVVAELLNPKANVAKPSNQKATHKRCSSDCMKEPPRRLSCGTSAKQAPKESKAAQMLEMLVKVSPERKKIVDIKKKACEVSKVNQTAETSLARYINYNGGNNKKQLNGVQKKLDAKRLSAVTPKPNNLSQSVEHKFKRFASSKKGSILTSSEHKSHKRSVSTQIKVRPLLLNAKKNEPKANQNKTNNTTIKKCDITISLQKKKTGPTVSGKATPSGLIAHSARKTKEVPLGFCKYLTNKKDKHKTPTETRIVECNVDKSQTQATTINPLSVENVATLNQFHETDKLANYIHNYFKEHNEPPPTTIDFYRVGKLLGKGAFGKVNLGMHKLTGKLVALKAVKKEFLGDSVSKKKVMQEFSILKQIRHPHIIRLYETFESDKNIIFVIELCSGGDLLTYVRKRRRLKEHVARFVFRQILEGLSYCHNKGILHRDIKLDNVLLNGSGEIKICDFGVSKLIKKHERLTEQCGTPAYIAPEILKGKGYEGFGVDVWSAGVVLYAILHGSVPFNASEMYDLHKQVIKGKYKVKEGLSSEAVDLLSKMLELDPAKRIATDQIFQHPWMKQVEQKGTLNLFGEEEKEAIAKEYEYKANKEKQDDTETLFTEQNIDVTQNDLTRNNTTKSLILAPFNSVVSCEEDNQAEVSETYEKKKVIKFAAKVKEIDRQYEKNNNGEVDNGVYNKCAYSTERSEQSKHSELYMDLINGEEEKTEEDGHANEIRVSECIIEGIKSERIDEELLEKVVKFGYPKEFVMNSLNGHELNHATTTYYLMTNNKQL
eukprot:TRINITY_DN135136_c0_g1_i1.p1 TRINITY_DN135136_c0_g1~~TRINITY_DN135136_c0_g1_i1.p1  ORF type:complete len:1066 (-),score=121.39 TRINITY_DN135136_c0_g1_i1:164-3244(-)